MALWHRAEHRLRGWVEADEAYVGSKRERGLRGGREVGHKTVVGVAVEQRRHTAGSTRLTVLEGVSFEQDLGPFVRGAIDAGQAVVCTDGFSGYLPPSPTPVSRLSYSDKQVSSNSLEKSC